MQCRIKNVVWFLLSAAPLVAQLSTATVSGLQLAPDTGRQPSAEATTAPVVNLCRHESTRLDKWQHRRLLAGPGRAIAQTTATTTTLPSSDAASSSRPINFFGGLPAEGKFQVSWSTNPQPSTGISQLQFEVGQAAPRPSASPPAAVASATSSGANSTSLSSNKTSNAESSVSQTEFASPSTSSGSNSSNELASPTSTNTAPSQPLRATELRPVGGDQLPYVYQYVTGITEGNPLGLPLSDTPGMELSRWVMCAWSVSNSTAPALLGDGAIKHAEQLINNFTAMAPGQIQLAAFANVTVAFAFNGIGTWTNAASGALIQAMSAMTGGYDPSLISVQLDAPEYGIPAAAFIGSGKVPVTTVPVNNLVVGTRRVGSSSIGSNIGSSNGGNNSSTRRRLLSRRLLQDSRGTSLQQKRTTASRALVAHADGSDEPWGPDAGGTNASSNGWTKVWVNFSRMAPLNVSSVLGSLSGSCGVDVRDGAAGLTDKPCGSTIRQLFMQTGMDVRLAHYAHWLKEKPMVSLSIRLAIGITPAQAATGTDAVLANWLSEPLNIHRAITMSGVGDPIGADALIKWLIKPEIWYAMLAPIPGSDALTPATIVGIALGSAAFASLVAAGLVFLLLRHRRQQAAQAEKDDVLSSTSSRRRRRHMRKRRYIAPEPPQPETAAAPLNSSNSSSHAPTAEQAATVDDDVLTPGQIRPALKELGDSVTSAVRFEDEDAAEEAAAAGAADVTAAAARTAAVAAATGFGSGTSHGAAAGSGQSLSQQVLAARAALIAEQRQGSAFPAATGSTNGWHASAAAAAGVPPSDVKADATAVPDLARKGGPAACCTNKQQAAAGPAELQLAVLRGLTDANRAVSVASTVAPVTPSADRHPSLQLQLGDTIPTQVYNVQTCKAYGFPTGVHVGTTTAPTKAATPPSKGSPSAASDGSASFLGPATPHLLDLAVLGVVPSPLPQPKGNGKTKASPFAVSYNFGDLAVDSASGAIDVAALDNVEPTKSSTAKSRTPALQLPNKGPLAERCAAADGGMRGSTSEVLLGSVSTEIALADNGSCTQVSSRPRQQQAQQACPNIAVHGDALSSQSQHREAMRHMCISLGSVVSSHGSRHDGNEHVLSGWGSACSSSGSSYNAPHSAQSVQSLGNGYPSQPSTNGPATMGSALTVGGPVTSRFGPCRSVPAHALPEQAHQQEATQAAIQQQHTWD